MNFDPGGLLELLDLLLTYRRNESFFLVFLMLIKNISLLTVFAIKKTLLYYHYLPLY